jgi:hypothetical protein
VYVGGAVAGLQVMSARAKAKRRAREAEHDEVDAAKVGAIETR